MEKRNNFIVGLGGPPSTGKTETLDELSQILDVPRISYGNIVRAYVLAGERLGIINDVAFLNHDALRNYYRDLPPDLLQQIALCLRIEYDRNSTEYLFREYPLNGQLRDHGIGTKATYLGGNPALPLSVHALLHAALDHNCIIEGRKDAVQMMDLCGWMLCSRRERIAIYQREHGSNTMSDDEIFTAIMERQTVEIETGLLQRPNNAVDLIRLNDVSNARVAQVFSELVIEVRRGQVFELPQNIAIGSDFSCRIARR